jgi:peptidoglycan/xylan/chitin deacetylase (PgdA/CDA1 family)
MSLAGALTRAASAVLLPAGDKARLGVLIYHRILPRKDELIDEPTAAEFDVQLGALRECFNVLPLREAVERLENGTLPPRAVAITFDDGYADNAEIALPILKKHRLPATFFIASGYLNGGRMFNDTVIEAVRRLDGPTVTLPLDDLRDVPIASTQEKRNALPRLLKAVKYLSPDERVEFTNRIASLARSPLPDDLMMQDPQVRQLSSAGMEIGGHTVNHPILTRVSPDIAKREIEENRSALEALTGQKPTLFAYPNGGPNTDYAWVHTQIARAAGYRAAVSTAWGVAQHGSDLFQLPRFTPWDRDPRRFVLRLLRNFFATQPRIVAA